MSLVGVEFIDGFSHLAKESRWVRQFSRDNLFY